MPTPRMTKAQAAQYLNFITENGGYMGAAKASGVSENTWRSRNRIARDVLRMEPLPEPETPEVIVKQEKPRVRVQAGRPEGNRMKVLGIGDVHVDPRLSNIRGYWMGRHAAEIGADYVQQIGDLGTLDSLNRYIANETILGKMKSPFSRDMEALKDFLGEFDRGLNSHRLKKRITLGNHEYRAWRYEDDHPEVQGFLTGELTCTLEDHEWEWSPFGEWQFLGGVGFTHAPINRVGKAMAGETHQNVLNKMVFDVVRGHDHQNYDKPSTKLGPIGGVKLVGLGCALPYGHLEEYMKHSLHGWDWGVKELVIQDGHITDSAWVSMLELERRYAKI